MVQNNRQHLWTWTISFQISQAEDTAFELISSRQKDGEKLTGGDGWVRQPGHTSEQYGFIRSKHYQRLAWWKLGWINKNSFNLHRRSKVLQTFFKSTAFHHFNIHDMPSGIGFHSNEPPCHSVDFAKSRVDFAERHSQQFDVTLTSPVTVFWARIEITCQEGFDVAVYGCMTIIISSWKRPFWFVLSAILSGHQSNLWYKVLFAGTVSETIWSPLSIEILRPVGLELMADLIVGKTVRGKTTGNPPSTHTHTQRKTKASVSKHPFS